MHVQVKKTISELQYIESKISTVCNVPKLCVLHASYNSGIFFSIAERKTPDSLSGDLVNGDHLSIPGMHDYSYGSLGAYNQMSPSPKSVAPQSPSSVPRTYALSKS